MSASFTNSDHHVLSNIMIILKEKEEDKKTKVYRDTSAATSKKEKDHIMSDRQREQHGWSGGSNMPRA